MNVQRVDWLFGWMNDEMINDRMKDMSLMDGWIEE